MPRLCLFALCASLLLTAGSASATDEGDADCPTYTGRAFLFEVEIERGVELGWSGSDVPPKEILLRVADSLERRLRRSGKFVEAVVREEPGNRLAVVFIGPQWRSFEELVRQGLSGAGRIALEVVEANESQPAGEPRVGAGSCEEGAPLGWWSRADEEAVAVCAGERHLLEPDSAERLDIVGLTTGSQALRITLNEEGWSDLKSFLARVEDRDLVLTIDGRVVDTGLEPTALLGAGGRSLVVDGAFTLDELRPVVFAFAGEPLPAPLRYLGIVERPLPNVKHRDSPTAIE